MEHGHLSLWRAPDNGQKLTVSGWHIFPEIRIIDSLSKNLKRSDEDVTDSRHPARDGPAGKGKQACPRSLGDGPPGHPWSLLVLQNDDFGLPLHPPGRDHRQAHPGALLQTYPWQPWLRQKLSYRGTGRIGHQFGNIHKWCMTCCGNIASRNQGWNQFEVPREALL